jgi:hypothetical protein
MMWFWASQSSSSASGALYVKQTLGSAVTVTTTLGPTG